MVSKPETLFYSLSYVFKTSLRLFLIIFTFILYFMWINDHRYKQCK